MKVLVIAGNAGRRFLRDRTALFFTLALPVTIILVIGSATSGFDDSVYPIGIVVHATGELSEQLVEALEAHDRIELRTYDDRGALAKDVRRGAVPAGVVIPDDYDTELAAARPVEVELLLDQTRGAAAAVRSIVSGAIAERGAVLQAASFAHERAGAPMDAARDRADRVQEQLAGVAVGVRSETIGRADDQAVLAPGVGYQAPSNLILFVFITSVAGSSLLIQSRQQRVLQRMFATPTGTRSILLGEGLARFGIAAFQAAFIFAVGTFVFGVEWGQPLGAAALIVMFVLVGTSVGMLFGTIFSTPEQAGTIGSMMGISMGMLGGCMWPLEIVPEPMRILGHLFPHAWAMDAWIDLIGRGGTIGDIATELGVLAVFVAVLLPLGTWRLRRALVA